MSKQLSLSSIMPFWFIPIFKLLFSEVVEEGAAALGRVIRKSMSSGQVVFQFPVGKANHAYVSIQSFIAVFDVKTYTISKDEEMMTFCFPGTITDKHRAFFSDLTKEG